MQTRYGCMPTMLHDRNHGASHERSDTIWDHMARSIWSGSIAFGLVSIPIDVHASTRDTSIHFHLVTPDGGCRLRQKLYCPDTGKEYDFSQTARGVEVAPGEIVVVEPSELKALRPESGHTIDIRQFAGIEEIDPIYFDRSYILTPGKRAEKAYALLRDAIRDSGKVGIGTMVMREKQYVVLIRVYRHVLLVNSLRYAEELKDVGEFNIPEALPTDKRELSLAKQLIESLEAPFDPAVYKNQLQEDIAELVAKKAKGETVPQAHGERRARKEGKIIDLMDRLKASIESAPSRRRAAVKPRSAARARGGKNRRTPSRERRQA